MEKEHIYTKRCSNGSTIRYAIYEENGCVTELYRLRQWRNRREWYISSQAYPYYKVQSGGFTRFDEYEGLLNFNTFRSGLYTGSWTIA